MKIAVHHREDSYSTRWIQTLEKRGIDSLVVNGYDNNIIDQVSGCDAVLWHLNHGSLTDLIFSRHILQACDEMGIHTFPNLNTRFHFDDKVTQKYLLEAINAPLVPSYVFYNRKAAYKWLEGIDYPVVFKLRRGAGASNVKLVHTRSEANKLVRKAFGKGFPFIASPVKDISTRIRTVKSRNDILGKIKRAPSSISAILNARKIFPRENAYILFQEYIPDNTFDIRVTTIGDRAFTFTRGVRPNDFRASGSGELIYYNPGEADFECIKIAFEVSQKLGFQSMAYDFVTDPDSGEKLIVEISYVYQDRAVCNCAGYFNSKLNWVVGNYWPQDVILDDVITAIQS